MKKVLLFVLLSLIILTYTNAQSWISTKQFSSTGNVEPVDIKVDGNGDIYIVGNYEQALTIGGLPPLTYTGITNDIFLCKFNEQGTAIWARRIGGDDRETVGGIAIDPSNNVYVVGGFKSPILGFEGGTTTLVNDDNYDAFLAKYDGTGSLLYANSVFWGNDVERLIDVTYDATNDYVVVVGIFKDSLIYSNAGTPDTIKAIGPKDHILARFLPIDGSFVDMQTYYGSHTQSVFKNVNTSIVGGSVDGYFITGDLRGTIWFSPADSVVGETSAMDILVARFNANLAYDWSRTGGGSDYDHVNSSGSDRYGNIYFTGKAQSLSIILDSTETFSSVPRPSLGGQDYLIAKYNRSGKLQWFRRDGGPGTDNAYGLAVLGRRILYSGNIGEGTNIQSGFAVYDINGNLIATDQITGDGDETGLNVAFDQTGDSTYVIGNFNGDSLIAGPWRLDNTASGLQDGFFVKYGFKFSIFEDDKQNILCNGDSTGSIIVGTQFGTEPIAYEWIPDVSSGPVATGLAAGDYQIVATDGGGRKDTLQVTLTEPPAMVITLQSIDSTSCHILSTGGEKNDGKVNISITGGTLPFSYSWSPSGENTEDGVMLPAGNNTVTVTDDNGCVIDSTFFVPQPDKITFTGSTVDDIIDPPGSNGAVNLVTMGGTPAYTYDWSGPAGFSSTDASINSLINNGIYSLSVTDANLCIQDTSFTVASNTGITIRIDTIINVKCKGDENGGASVSVIGGSGDFTYEWRTSGGTPVGGNSPDLVDVSARTYYVKVTDNVDTQLTNEAEVVVDEPASTMIAAFDSTRHISCFGEEDGYLRVVVTGGWGNNSYLWTPSGSTTFFANNLEAGEHTVIITDAGGCEKVLNRELIEPDELSVMITEETPIICNGMANGALGASASGGTPEYSYVWDDPGAQITPIATNLEAGTYQVDVTDDKGCTSFATYMLNEPDVFSLVDVNTSWDGSSGEITITVAGGSSNYRYVLEDVDSISKSELIHTFTELTGGDYFIKVLDENGCGTVRDTMLALRIGDLLTGFDLLLYPNPSTGQFTIELENPEMEDIDLEIINLMGQRVFRQLYESYGEARFIQTIDLGNQAKGTYFMRINGLPVRAKLMIE